jgi:hypothetical protein
MYLYLADHPEQYCIIQTWHLLARGMPEQLASERGRRIYAPPRSLFMGAVVCYIECKQILYVGVYPLISDLTRPLFLISQNFHSIPLMVEATRYRNIADEMNESFQSSDRFGEPSLAATNSQKTDPDPPQLLSSDD